MTSVAQVHHYHPTGMNRWIEQEIPLHERYLVRTTGESYTEPRYPLSINSKQHLQI